MSSTYCENCNNRVSDNKAKKCSNCGALLKQRMNSGQDKAAFIGFLVVITMVIVVLTGRISDFTDEGIQQEGRPDKEEILAQMPEKQLENKMAAAQQEENQDSDFTDKIELNYLELEKVHPGKETDVASREIKASDTKSRVTSKNAAVNTKKLEIAKLEKEVKAIPVSRVSDNLRIYRQLLMLDPENLRYRKKVAYYEMKHEKREPTRGRKEEFVIINEAKWASVLSYPVQGALLGNIPAGEKVQILEKQFSKKGGSTQTWFRVRFDGSYGWISKNDTSGEINNETVIAEKNQKN